MLKGGFWLLTVGFWLLVSCGDDEPTANSQEPIVYSSPIDYEIVLAGNFGEPRPYHFHGGIDVKTGNVEGVQEKDLYGNTVTPLEAVNRKPILPEESEIAGNTRARSAKLRIAERRAAE